MTLIKTESRELWILVWPIIIAQLGQISFGLIDTAMVSQLGTTELAATAFANSVFWFGSILAIGVCNVTAPLVAACVGGKDEKGAGAILHQSKNLSIGLGIVFSFIMVGIGSQFDHFKQDPHVASLGMPFFMILLTSVVPMLVFQSYRQFLEATGHQKEPMYMMFAGLGLNFILNYLLIYGHGGFPRLGINGAAIATSLTRWAMMFAIIYVCYSNRDFKRYVQNAQPWLKEIAKYKELLTLGLPVGLMLFFEVGAFAFSTILAGQIDKESLAAHQIVLSIASFTFMVPLSLSFAASVRVGLAVGEKRPDLVRRRGFVSLAFAITFMALMSFMVFALRRYLSASFSADESVIALSMSLFVLAAFFQIFDGIQVVCSGILRALKDVKVPMYITLLGYWAVSLPLGYYLMQKPNWGVQGIWVGLTLGLMLAATLLLSRFRWILKKLEKKIP